MRCLYKIFIRLRFLNSEQPLLVAVWLTLHIIYIHLTEESQEFEK
jgi:hypothetical protein